MKKILLFFAVVASLASCSIFKPVQFNPPKDPKMPPCIQYMSQFTDSAFKSIDLSYDEMKPRYAVINGMLDSIKQVDIARLKPNNIIQMVLNIQKVFASIQGQHKGVVIPNTTQISIWSGQMRELWKPLLDAEKSLK